MKINIGDFALCQKGELGLILWEHNCKHKRTNKPYILYQGINLTPGKKWGLNWQSNNPTKITKSKMKQLLNNSIYVERKK